MRGLTHGFYKYPARFSPVFASAAIRAFTEPGDLVLDLGAAPGQVLRRVVLPLTWPGIVAGSILVFIPSLGAYLAPDLLGGARYVYVGSLIQSQFAVARDMPFGAALSFLLSVLVVLLLLAFRAPIRSAESL